MPLFAMRARTGIDCEVDLVSSSPTISKDSHSMFGVPELSCML